MVNRLECDKRVWWWLNASLVVLERKFWLSGLAINGGVGKRKEKKIDPGHIFLDFLDYSNEKKRK